MKRCDTPSDPLAVRAVSPERWRWLATVLFMLCALFSSLMACRHAPEVRREAAGAPQTNPQAGQVGQFSQSRFNQLLISGQGAMDRNDYQAALEAFRAAEALEPGNSLAPHWMGHALFALDQHGQAAQAYQRSNALKEDPSNHIMLGRLLLSSPDRTGEALPHARRAVEMASGNPDAWNVLADAYLAAGDLDRASEAVQAGLARNPSDVVRQDLLGLLAKIHMARGEYAEAHAMIGDRSLVFIMFSDVPEGKKVMRLYRGGPADQAGIRVGDILVALDGTPLAGRPDRALTEQITSREFGSMGRLTIFRDGSLRDVDVVMGVTPDLAERARKGAGAAAPSVAAVSTLAAAPVSVVIDDVRLDPPAVLSGSKFDLRIGFTVRGSAAGGGKHVAKVGYSIAEKGKVLFTNRPVEVAAATGLGVLRVEHVTAGRKGAYVITVTVASGDRKAERSLPLIVD